LLELSRSPALQETVARAGVTRDHLPGTDLPPIGVGRTRLQEALVARRSRRPPGVGPLRLETFASILGAAYGSERGRRAVPSGGALFPLELYAVALEVESLERGVHHYNPFRHRLELLRAADRKEVASTLV